METTELSDSQQKGEVQLEVTELVPVTIETDVSNEKVVNPKKNKLLDKINPFKKS